jgi:hypothetical protein
MLQTFKRSRVSTRSENDEVQEFADRYRLRTRIEADGTKIIPGKFGHLYLYDKHLFGVMVMPSVPRRQYWGHVRSALRTAGFTLTQDGDGEGCATFDPADDDQSIAAIKAAGIRCKRQLSPEQIKRQISWLRASAGRAL